MRIDLNILREPNDKFGGDRIYHGNTKEFGQTAFFSDTNTFFPIGSSVYIVVNGPRICIEGTTILCETKTVLLDGKIEKLFPEDLMAH